MDINSPLVALVDLDIEGSKHFVLDDPVCLAMDPSARYSTLSQRLELARYSTSFSMGIKTGKNRQLQILELDLLMLELARILLNASILKLTRYSLLFATPSLMQPFSFYRPGPFRG